MRSFCYWSLAVIVTLFVSIFQRLTGPSQPVTGQITVNDRTISYRLERSYLVSRDMPVKIEAYDHAIDGALLYKRFRTDDPWTEMKMERRNKVLQGYLPRQPRGGKLAYQIFLETHNQKIWLNDGRITLVRFRGHVPAVLLILHIIFMFTGMLIAVRTGLETFKTKPKFGWLLPTTIIILFFGGFILGPWVQKYAFGQFWTGFPLGYDLTDNKVIISIILWIVAIFLKKRSKWWVLTAAIVMLIVYLIPHSLFGSELDYKSGKMKNLYGMNASTPGQ